MSDDDRQKREEEATRQLLDVYAKLVGMTAQEIAGGDKAQHLADTIDGMTESQAKAMLMARIAAEAVHANEIVERIESAPYEGLGGDPTMN